MQHALLPKKWTSTHVTLTLHTIKILSYHALTPRSNSTLDRRLGAKRNPCRPASAAGGELNCTCAGPLLRGNWPRKSRSHSWGPPSEKRAEISPARLVRNGNRPPAFLPHYASARSFLLLRPRPNQPTTGPSSRTAAPFAAGPMRVDSGARNFWDQEIDAMCLGARRTKLIKGRRLWFWELGWV